MERSIDGSPKEDDFTYRLKCGGTELLQLTHRKLQLTYSDFVLCRETYHERGIGVGWFMDHNGIRDMEEGKRQMGVFF